VIDEVVPHPIEDTFALLHPIHSSSGDKRSQILVYGVSSSTALRTRIVPFQFLNVLWYSLAPSSTRTSPFCLVGITKSWSVVLVGDEVSSPEKSMSSPTGLVLGQPERKRTLFQDIFGTSALVDVSKELPPRSQPPEAHTQPWTGKEGAKFFDLPAYLTPPLETLYRPLMEGFLRPRNDNDVDLMDVVAEQSQGDEGIAMEAGEPVRATIPTPFPSRVVGEEEMQFMINVFRQHALGRRWFTFT
jgi:NET1-associated nuclear protein 1 (U3 small nucleolar RNA-associated protein 17)